MHSSDMELLEIGRLELLVREGGDRANGTPFQISNPLFIIVIAGKTPQNSISTPHKITSVFVSTILSAFAYILTVTIRH
jgi:hypothetical protein